MRRLYSSLFNTFQHLLPGGKKVAVTLVCVFIALTTNAQVTANVGTFNWSQTTAWVGGVLPAAGQSVTIPIGSTINVDITTPTVNNIIINGSMVITNTLVSKLNYNGNLTVAGSLVNNGGIEQYTNGRTFLLNGTGTYIHNPNNNTLIDETIFSKSVETFSTTSNLTIQKWFDLGLPLGDPTRVSGNFGNVTLSLADTLPWEQDGQFMTSTIVKRIYGTLTVTSGAVSMDNGTGNTWDLYLNDVIINGTGRIIFSSGTSRALILITNNFTDISTNVKPTIIQDNCFGFTQWTCNGNAIINHNFLGINGAGVSPGGDLRVNINGNLSIGGGTVTFVREANAPLVLAVTGNTTITGAGTAVSFIDGNSGNMTFTTNNFTISGGAHSFVGGNPIIPGYTGVANITVNNDLFINTGPSVNTFLNSISNVQPFRFYVGHDASISAVGSTTIFSRSRGRFTLYVANNLTHSGGKIVGQIDTAATMTDSLFVGGNFLMNNPAAADYFRFKYNHGPAIIRTNGTFTIQDASNTIGNGFVGIYGGTGNLTFNCVGNYSQANGRFTGIYGFKAHLVSGAPTFTNNANWSMSGGYFRLIENYTRPTTSAATMSANNMNYTGGSFNAFNAVHDATGTATFTVTGLLQVTFPAPNAAIDSFVFVNQATLGSTTSLIKLSVTCGGNFNITGGNGKFVSSIAEGRETFAIGGEFNTSGGINSFNNYPNTTLPTPHPVTITVGSNMNVNGGVTYLSAHNDSVTVTINGNLSIGLGEVSVQGGDGVGIVNVLGGYTQVGGTFYFHKNTVDEASRNVTVTINSNADATGNFSQTGGVINFDNNTASIQNFLYIKSPNITLGGTGSFTMANAGTNSILGLVYFAYPGIMNYNRTTTTHNIQGINLQIIPGTIVLLDPASQNFQVGSRNIAVNLSLEIKAGGVLDLRDKQLISNVQQSNSGILVFGRIKTTRAQGFYDGTTNAAISSAGAMSFILANNSVVEYYGSDNQIVTGIGVGTATTAAQKYSILEINFQGTANTEFVYPTNIPNDRSVFVRTTLILNNGELNLDNDHDPLAGGRSIIIERDSSNAIQRINGYIRSEVYDSTASVIWKINAKGSPHIFPFGRSSTEYIPFTFTLPAGSLSADTVIVSTYRTSNTSNVPYPPGVTHVNGLAGADNSLQTVDRFWYLEVTGAAASADITFVCTPSESTGITSPRAQRWIQSSLGWEYPYQGVQSNPTVTSAWIDNATAFPLNWWTLSGLASPLPISLLEFKGKCENDEVVLRWTTGTEEQNEKFTLLRSKDGVTFEMVGTVKGAGNSSIPLPYDFTDHFAPEGINYYKLRQTDYNGTYSEFGPIVVESCEKAATFDVNVIPSNPTQTDVILNLVETGKYRFTLFNMEGKPVYSTTAFFSAPGMNVTTLNHGYLSGGIYVLRIEGGGIAVSEKIPLGLVK